jgi:transcriptional regulator of arginine metabolism
VRPPRNANRIVRPVNGRRLAKDERQRLVASLVSRRRLGTQDEVRLALAAAGCTVTQATVSRDIAELGLEKTEDDLGRPRYVLPERRAASARESLAAVLSQFGRRAVAAENIVVVQSELGSAPAIARALDRLEHPRVVGTLAGDDTCLVVAPTASDAEALAGELDDLIG